MKRISLLLVTLLLLVFSCNKDNDEAIDCAAEAPLISLSYTVDSANPLKVICKVNYMGEHAIENIQWDFGDGQTLTTTGTTVEHLYPDLGIFPLKAIITLRNGGASCSTEAMQEVDLF